jgi:hypothetical protein
VLNREVRILFVPDASAVAPPWDARLVPPDPLPLTTPTQARVLSVLHARYPVTPNATLAGTVERLDPPAEGEPGIPGRVVWYITPAEYDRYAGELAELLDIVSIDLPDRPVSELRGYAVVEFLRDHVADPSWLHPYDAMLLGRTTP